MNGWKVSAIVPAFNEAPRIGAVLSVLATYPGFDEVLVVDDGSTDDTSKVAGVFPVRIIKNETNLGKGKAMNRGVLEAKGDVIFFADADIIGLTHEIISEVLSPVLSGKYDMFIAMHNRKIYTLRFILSMVPLVGGERAVTRSLWKKVPAYYKEKFRIEAGLNFYAKYFGKGFDYAVYPNMSRIKKERKFGFREGLKRRIDMYEDELAAEWNLTFNAIPPTLKNQRLEIISFFGSVTGMLIGFIFAATVENQLLHSLAIIVTITNFVFAALKFKRISDLVIRG